MLVRDLLNPNSVRISLPATVRQAAELLSASHASDLMVIDSNGEFVGVLSEGDLLRKCMPQFESLIADGSLSAAEDLFQESAKAMSDQSIEPWFYVRSSH